MTWHKTCCTWWAPDVLHVICTRFCLATWACVLQTVCGALSHSVLTQDQADCVSDPTMFCFLHDSHWNASSFKSMVWRHWFEHQTRCFSDRHLKHQAMEVFRNVQSTFVHSRISQWGTVWVPPHWPNSSGVDPGSGRSGVQIPLATEFFQVESYQWLKNWHSSDYPARRLALEGQCWDWSAQCPYSVIGWGRKFDLQLLCQCGST